MPDHPYANADSSVNLQTTVWGEKAEHPEDSFTIAWSEQEKAWVAIYELNFSVGKLAWIPLHKNESRIFMETQHSCSHACQSHFFVSLPSSH